MHPRASILYGLLAGSSAVLSLATDVRAGALQMDDAYAQRFQQARQNVETLVRKVHPTAVVGLPLDSDPATACAALTITGVNLAGKVSTVTVQEPKNFMFSAVDGSSTTKKRIEIKRNGNGETAGAITTKYGGTNTQVVDTLAIGEWDTVDAVGLSLGVRSLVAICRENVLARQELISALSAAGWNANVSKADETCRFGVAKTVATGPNAGTAGVEWAAQVDKCALYAIEERVVTDANTRKVFGLSATQKVQTMVCKTQSAVALGTPFVLPLPLANATSAADVGAKYVKFFKNYTKCIL